ncbi:hypothetical protein ACHAW6_004948 [Cyclotella cf. meneghiniana]
MLEPCAVSNIFKEYTNAIRQIIPMPSTFEWSVSILIPLQLTWLSSHLLQTHIDDSNDAIDHSTRPSHAVLFLLYLVLDASLGHLFHLLLTPPARRLSHRLPGALVPPPAADEARWTRQEEQTNDPSLTWPTEEALRRLPPDWRVARTSGGRENGTSTGDERSLRPYRLNHVRGSTRVRHAAQRAGAALGTAVASVLVCRFASRWIRLEDVGLSSRSVREATSDVGRGFFVGSFIVTVLFVTELRLGWVRIVSTVHLETLSPLPSSDDIQGYLDTVEPNELFLLNFSWDVLFHIAVSINEEIMLRGWMFVLGSRGIAARSAEWFQDDRTAATFVLIVAVLSQSTVFAMLHFHSPGSNWVSLVNLFLGGIAASWNFLVAGGTLWSGIGWHFGWNIFMGHVLGRSTSGIPMSCAVVNVVPRPCSNGTSYDKYHGGMFGPEQGVLAPLAYVMGMCMMMYIYGVDGLVDYRERLVLQMAKNS